MSAPINPSANVAYRVLEALGLGADIERARLVLAMWARPVTRLSAAECREILAAVTAAAAQAQEQHGGDHQYDRADGGPQGTGRPWRGVRFGAVTDHGEVAL